MSTIIEGNAELLHLNIRREGPQDSKVLAIDMKLSGCETGLTLLARLLGADSEQDVFDAFWREDGEPKYSGLEPVSSWGELSGCLVKLPGVVLNGATLRKFKFGIKANATCLTDFSVTVSDPPDRVVSVLSDLLVEGSMRIVVERLQDDLDLVPAGEAA